MSQPLVAFLGTGLMGGAMARNLAASGYPLQVWNRTRAKAESLSDTSATIAASVCEAVTDAGIVISMLTDGPATWAILNEALPHLAPDTLWIDMASTKPAEARAAADLLGQAGHRHLDAPVSGGTKGAQAATLAIMAGGKMSDMARARPVLETLGRPVHVGPSGAGQLSKLCNQAIVAISIGAVAEAMLLAQAGGADPAALRAALKGGFADSTILQQHGARMTNRDFTPGGPSAIQLKDLDNILAEAAGLGLTLPMAQDIRARYAHLVEEMARGDMDHAALYLELLARNGMG